jgi:hypothetical protein
MIILVYFLPNTSGLDCAKNLRKWAEKAFASSTLDCIIGTQRRAARERVSAVKLLNWKLISEFGLLCFTWFE